MNCEQAIELKLGRAKHHLEEIEGIVAPWRDSHPYDRQEVVEGKDKVYAYRLKFTSEPDQSLPTVVGDFIQNVRASLDYLMTGLVPSDRRTKTYFPIFDVDPFAKDPDNRRKYLQRDAMDRRRWRTYTKGVPPNPLRLIHEFQPYALGAHRRGNLRILWALKKISDADKHRELTTTPLGLEHVHVQVDGETNETFDALCVNLR
ncbi:MAG: hypothetical protein M0Z42_04270 [Actinomycetota bacterium]|nr:hypothetical protein [Actinomycetota bacterium]